VGFLAIVGSAVHAWLDTAEGDDLGLADLFARRIEREETTMRRVAFVLADFSCPSGQSLFLQEVTCTGTFVSDETGNTFHATPDPISTGPIHIKV
jgi:hypothetical protein